MYFNVGLSPRRNGEAKQGRDREDDEECERYKAGDKGVKKKVVVKNAYNIRNTGMDEKFAAKLSGEDREGGGGDGRGGGSDGDVPMRGDMSGGGYSGSGFGLGPKIEEAD
ncbi:hypothetical protein V6N11_062220 [Hibiscus sabdariffa]|uniref:Uncharacterized protein n=1 Tax=Hibiscus sabdariffa TaxID=183260 RepID=A0ABR2PS43_9ROSI